MMNPDYRDMLSAFAEENVSYLLAGAYALAAHGHVRATGDMDLWVKSSRDNASRVIAALARFGARMHRIEARDFETPDTVFQIGAAAHRHTDDDRRRGLRGGMVGARRGRSRGVEGAGDQPAPPAAEQTGDGPAE